MGMQLFYMKKKLVEYEGTYISNRIEEFADFIRDNSDEAYISEDDIYMEIPRDDFKRIMDWIKAQDKESYPIDGIYINAGDLAELFDDIYKNTAVSKRFTEPNYIYLEWL